MAITPSGSVSCRARAVCSIPLASAFAVVTFRPYRIVVNPDGNSRISE
jgi:hypothetical protein